MTLERTEIIRDLRLGKFDVLVGINLLREGLDIPEVSLIAILDADKEGFLRSETSLIQTVGRAARNAEGRVIMYADKITRSMAATIEETARRRQIQSQYNEEHGIITRTIKKDIRDNMETLKLAEEEEIYGISETYNKDEIKENIEKLQAEMMEAATNLQFERAAQLRDKIKELEEKSIGRPSTYATIIDTLQKRGYATLEKTSETSKTKVFVPTKQGMLTDEKLGQYFSDVINVEYTADMEKTLDEISEGKQD